MNPTPFLHWGSKGHDAVAIFALLFASASGAITAWLQVIVLTLTIVFMALGIYMRWQKIKEEKDEDGD